ncbi:hypothetical protein [Streptomyces sp. XH2]|uniref:hypothetical protein n=1 Tax=Streptomyces sp. XH2 TaxID=3412483 RepID=UPI003C7C99D5
MGGRRLAFASDVTTPNGYGQAPLAARPEMPDIETPAGIETPCHGVQLRAPASLLSFDLASGALEHTTWWHLEPCESWLTDVSR